MTDRRLPLTLVVKTDFLALVGALLPPIGAILWGAAALGFLPDRSRSMVDGGLLTTPKEGASVFALLAIGAAMGGALLIAWRLWKIRAAFASGHRVPGTIARLRPFKDRAYVDYRYVVGREQHVATHFVHRTKAVRRLFEGQAVSVAIDPRRPRGGFVVEIFDG